jgi:H+/Cl- antiporter ClcA
MFVDTNLIQNLNNKHKTKPKQYHILLFVIISLFFYGMVLLTKPSFFMIKTEKVKRLDLGKTCIVSVLMGVLGVIIMELIIPI